MVVDVAIAVPVVGVEGVWGVARSVDVGSVHVVAGGCCCRLLNSLLLACSRYCCRKALALSVKLLRGKAHKHQVNLILY